MIVSNCCGAQFNEPGWPDNDICGACREHADGSCDEHVPYYQPEEKENNVQESYTCEECGKDLPKPEPDWDAMAKEDNLGIQDDPEC